MPREIVRCRELTEQGTLALQAGQLQAAEDQFRNALQANPADIDARRLFAEALFARGESTAATVQMEAASQLAPLDLGLAVRAGELRLASGDYSRAFEHADRAVADNPHYGPAWALRGHASWADGRPRQAIADLQRALVHTPGDRKVLLTLAQLYLQEGQARRSLTTVHQLLDLCPPGEEPPEALLVEAKAYLAVERPTDAAESLYAAVQKSTPTADTLYLLAKAEALCGRTEAAANTARTALAVDAAHRESLNLLAELSGSATSSTVLK